MATTINKQKILNQLLSVAPPPTGAQGSALPVLEQFVYALCRQDATPEQADRAYKNLRDRFFDWNEVRVSSVREVEDALEGLSNTEGRAQRLLTFLQEVFETTFSFDLEGLVKKGVKQAAKHLTRYQAADDYVGAWVIQRTLGGHAVPLDVSTRRVAERLGLLDGSQEDVEAARGSLEHVVPKAKGTQFTDAVSIVAEEHCWETTPNCPGCSLHAECPSAQLASAGGERNGSGHAARTRSR
jgi:endonuclease-3